MSARPLPVEAVTPDITRPLVRATGMRKHFEGGGHVVRAVQDVSFELAPGEVLGLVGESGSGKSTLGRLVLRLLEATAGRTEVDGTDIHALRAAELRRFRRKMQMVFQDPFASLNPRMTVGAALAESLLLHGVCARGEVRERSAALLARVGLPRDMLDRYPKAFSGGQRQRIAIARALAPEPRFIVADEPVSALDVSVQAEIVNLLQDLQRDLGLAMLFISHDLSVVESVADRVMVLYLGRTMEMAPTESLYRRPAHPYTAALLQAAPGGRRQRTLVLRGEIPSPAAPPSGCVFRTRCPFAVDACAREVPELRPVGPGHFKACIRDDLPL
ncbi:ATP-binding cassette domain-containing protein [Ramlibacter ginsenosidimutans]|uniref:ATP-binding cassette domain-containing protein n=1 Tax=Ramlibacter ginsenosidimutans TaxID=502333 RepID=A0A934TW77_9BURK|nr:oligopeptide/dipeptide ABC transporter ATP-binding protein [Ramlibacter ginsenosidimutans]MBK6008744.1 ATP-binding cassette domain-containing protein [Ramlibacter ginsenosidimutans]